MEFPQSLWFSESKDTNISWRYTMHGRFALSVNPPMVLHSLRALVASEWNVAVFTVSICIKPRFHPHALQLGRATGCGFPNLILSPKNVITLLACSGIASSLKNVPRLQDVHKWRSDLDKPKQLHSCAGCILQSGPATAILGRVAKWYNKWQPASTSWIVPLPLREA